MVSYSLQSPKRRALGGLIQEASNKVFSNVSTHFLSSVIRELIWTKGFVMGGFIRRWSREKMDFISQILKLSHWILILVISFTYHFCLCVFTVICSKQEPFNLRKGDYLKKTNTWITTELEPLSLHYLIYYSTWFLQSDWNGNIFEREKSILSFFKRM